MLLLATVGGCSIQDPSLKLVDSAQATVWLDGEAEVGPIRVKLKHRWDSLYPGRAGMVQYDVGLDEVLGGAPGAALVQRSGNQLTVQVDDAKPSTLGRIPMSDTSKQAHLIELPAGSHRLRIVATIQALRGGGLSPLLIGPSAAVEARFSTRRLIDYALPALYSASLLLMSGVAAGLWWRQRDTLFGCFSLSALLGSARNIDKLLEDAPLPWVVWGALMAIAYAWHLTFTVRFGVLVTGREPRWMRPATWWTLAAVTLLPAASFALGRPDLWTAALVGLAMFGAVGVSLVIRNEPGRRSPAVRFVLVAGSLSLIAGLHDILTVRTPALQASREPLSQHALFLFVLLMAGVVVARYNRSVAEVRTLNVELSRRVAERESQLEQAFETLRIEREQQAVAAERQRIMRDIHDGVGSQLVGLRSLVRQSDPDVPQLVQHVDAALDELRMAVDSMQPVHGDLATVLATLRYRLQPRLTASGVQVLWDVEALPGLQHLSPGAVLQVQRILLEGFTNVIRHAHATSVHVRAHLEEAGPSERCVCIELEDNGIGMAGSEGSRGHGMANIRARAELVGAQVEVRPAQTGGTCLSLRWVLSDAEGSGPLT